MQFNILNRKVHYWASFGVAVPLLVMIGSGLLLQSKKHWAWVQPAEHRGTGSVPAIDLEGVLASVKQVPRSMCAAGTTSIASTCGRAAAW